MAQEKGGVHVLGFSVGNQGSQYVCATCKQHVGAIHMALPQSVHLNGSADLSLPGKSSSSSSTAARSDCASACTAPLHDHCNHAQGCTELSAASMAV